MTVEELTRYDLGATMFRLIDANKQGYFSDPFELLTGDKNAVRVHYGRKEVVHFEITGKNKMTLYIRDKIQG